MNDEELQQLIQYVTTGIERLSGTERPLTKEEKKEKGLLHLKKDCLLKIKLAREKHETLDEFNNIVYYGTLDSWVGRNPIMRHFAKIRFRSRIF